MKKVFKYLILTLVVALLAVALFLSWITITEYRPDKAVLLSDSTLSDSRILHRDTFNLISWNIGYAGLGSEMDFFYDHGTHVRSSQKNVRKHIDNIERFIKSNDSVDFWLIQEIDISSKRSWEINEVKEVSEMLHDRYQVVFAKNYDVPFVPVPVTHPMGHAKSGMLTASKHFFKEAVRFAFPLIAPWPQRLFLLHRCFVLLRFPLTNGHDLVIINTHNTAYVYDSVLRMKELNIIKEKMTEEYAKGNYVVAGGDWNQNPPDFNPGNGFNGHRYVPAPLMLAKNAFPYKWIVAYDNKAPTNRKNNKPFVKGRNGTTVIDFFVLSPNIDLLDAQNIDLNFQDSDHNPVYVKIRLKGSGD